MRGWDQSERFDEAWALVAATYQCDVVVLNNVIELRARVDENRDLARQAESHIVKLGPPQGAARPAEPPIGDPLRLRGRAACEFLVYVFPPFVSSWILRPAGPAMTKGLSAGRSTWRRESGRRLEARGARQEAKDCSSVGLDGLSRHVDEVGEKGPEIHSEQSELLTTMLLLLPREYRDHERSQSGA